MKHSWVAIALLVGCGSSSKGSTPDGGSDPAADVTQWNQLVTQYDARRGDFLGKDVQELTAFGNQVFWLDTTNFDPKLVRYDAMTGTKLAYTFGIGGADTTNYRASASYVVTADPSEDPVVYSMYDVTAPQRLVDSITRKKPVGAQWDAYAVSGATVYIVDASVPGTTALLRWTPGAQPVQVTTLESAGAQVGEFEDFDVNDGIMVFVESGRLWRLDLASNHAEWLMNKTEISGAIDFRADGVMFQTASGVMFFSYANNMLTDITKAINANPFQVNATFASAAHWLQDFARWDHYVLYIGNEGLFAYDMTGNKITPVLLSPDSGTTRVDYRYPVALDNGTAFVTGLTSTSGATGADGPTYKLDLRSILN